MTLPKLYLRRREERRIAAGHPWVFSNEVATERSPLAGFAPGEFANVHAHPTSIPIRSSAHVW